jgi:hypothetical protein
LHGPSEKIEALNVELWLFESRHLELVAPVGHWRLRGHLWLHHLHHVEQWVRSWSNLLFVVDWLRTEETEWIHLLGSFLGMVRFVMDVVMGFLWLHKLHHVLLTLNGLINEFFNGLINTLEDLINIWEHQLEWVDILVLVVFVGILHLSVESLLLNVLSLNGLIPLVVESTDRGSQFSHIVSPSVELSHLLQVRVAGVINIRKFVQIEHFSKDIENIVENSLLHVLLEDAFPWVLKAPSFEVILNSLKVANFSILVESVDSKVTSILNLIDGYRPEILMSFVLEMVKCIESWLDPVTEAIIRDNMLVLTVPSFDETSVNVFQEQSVGLVMVQLWCVTLWAVFALLEHTK